MKIQLLTLVLFISFLFIGCNKKTEYLNESDSCELKLYDDFTYKFSFPTFFERKSENGFYEIDNDKIILSRKSFEKIDSVEIGYTHSWDGKDSADSLMLRFTNLNKEVIKVKIRFNNSIQDFESNDLGEIDIAYENLESLGIIDSVQVIKNYTVYFENKIYSPDMSYYSDSRRPRRIDFKLNQFIDQDYAILKRVSRIENDTIYINDISRKSIGQHNKLVKIK